MPGFDIGPFQRIVNVGWGGAPRILALMLDLEIGASSSVGPPTINFDFNISIGGVGGEILRQQLIINRSPVFGQPPPISQIVTPAMLAYYKIWAYEPFEESDPINHETGGGFWFITTDIAVFPDFVPSPYASALAAQTYLDEQAIIHPEYAGQLFFINFQPPFESFTTAKRYRQITFINLGAFTKNIHGNIEIDFSSELTPSNGDLEFNLRAGLYRGSLLNFLADDENHDFFGQNPDAGYEYDGTEDVPIEGTLVVHPEDPPSVTGPESPGGGQEG